MGYDYGMTEERDVKKLPAKCGAAILPYRLLKAGTLADEVIVATNQNAPFEGVSGNGSEVGKVSYETGDPIAVKYTGIIYISMSGVGLRGDRVTATAAGQGIKHTTQQGAYIFGIAMEAWTDGQVIPVKECQFYIGTYAT